MGQDTVLATIKQFKKALESVDIRVERLILFGSHAAGTAREDSDIDLVVISPNFSDKNYWERIDILRYPYSKKKVMIHEFKICTFISTYFENIRSIPSYERLAGIRKNSFYLCCL